VLQKRFNYDLRRVRFPDFSNLPGGLFHFFSIHRLPQSENKLSDLQTWSRDIRSRAALRIVASFPRISQKAPNSEAEFLRAAIGLHFSFGHPILLISPPIIEI
jgi:hypothetical protein